MQDWIFLAATCCLVWAAFAPLPHPVHWYFVALLVCSLAEWGSCALSGEASSLYLHTFIVSEAVVYLSMLALVVLALWLERLRWLATLSSLAVAAAPVAVGAIGRKIGAYDSLALAGGFLCLFCGTAIGLCACLPRTNLRRIYVSLMLLWMAQGAFSLGFTLHLWQPGWMAANEWLPAAMVCVGSLWVSIFCARPDRTGKDQAVERTSS